MKVLFLCTRNSNAQGDYLELTLVHGLRELLGEDFVEFPKKKILYGDFTESPMNKLHGKGMTFCTSPIKDASYDRNNLRVIDFDVVIHGSGFIYGDRWNVNHPNQFYTDGNDLYGNAERKITYKGQEVIGTQFLSKCFKRELVEDFDTVWPIGFGIPSHKISNINLEIKKQLFQQTSPADACFRNNSTQKFNAEEEYYKDLQESWFGLTCVKGGWECLRHYEIMANGAVLLFKNYQDKHPLMEPRNLPTISYHTEQELYEIMNRLVIDNKPTKEYIELYEAQQKWLKENGTTIARARYVMDKIEQYER